MKFLNVMSLVSGQKLCVMAPYSAYYSEDGTLFIHEHTEKEFTLHEMFDKYADLEVVKITAGSENRLYIALTK